MHPHSLITVFLATVVLPWGGLGHAAFSSEYAKNEIVFPNEPFEYRFRAGPTDMGWVKFTIAKEPAGLGPVTYQDSRTYQLHYEFVTRHMEPFIGISPEAFDRIALYEEGQKLILGAVITPPKAYPVTNTIRNWVSSSCGTIPTRERRSPICSASSRPRSRRTPT